MPRWSPTFIALLPLGAMAPHWLLAAQPSTPAQRPPLEASATRAREPAHPAVKLPLRGSVDITSERATLGPKGHLTLEGHVVLRQGKREIHANRVEYNSRSGAVRTSGRIEYIDPLVQVSGQGGSYSPLRGAQFDSAHFALRRNPARGSARRMQLTPRGVIRLTGVSFTTCRQSPPSWVLHAGSITLNTRNRVGYGANARIDLHGVPILYLPWVSFPLGNVRKSGFLFPTLGNTSRGGLQLSTPFYWNIAPNADFTLEPTEFIRRGVDVGGDLRWLTRRQRGEIDWDYLPNDAAYQHASRSRVRVASVTELPGGFRLSLEGENVSDTEYFEDFATGPEGTSTAFLDRRAALSYRDVHWNIQGMAQQFQTIDSTLAFNDRPYARVPDLTVDADYGWGPGDLLRYGFSSEVVDFQRPDHSSGVSGWRMDFRPQVSLNIDGPGYFIRPSIAWRATQYELSHTTAGQPSSPSRTLPIASLDTGLTLERISGAHGRRLVTIEPRVMYLYVPYRDQSKLPIFDTGLPDLQPVELFRTNRYVGADRVGDASQVSAGITTRLLDTASGRQYLSATIGEAFDFKTPRVRLPGEIARTVRRSDLVAQVTLTALRDWSANVGLQWNPQISQTQRAQVEIQYRPAPDRVINLGYRYERAAIEQAASSATLCATAPSVAEGSTCGIEQAEISAAWPIGRSWSLFARGIYSMKDHEALERFAGFEYRACCWSVRLGARRYVALRPTLTSAGTTARTGAQDTGIYLQVELTGLASVGSAPDAFLSETIPGYTPAAGQPLAPNP